MSMIKVGYPPQKLGVVEEVLNGYYVCAAGGTDDANFAGGLVTFNIDTNFSTYISLSDVERAWCRAQVDVTNLVGGAPNPNFDATLTLYLLLQGGGTVNCGSTSIVYYAATVDPVGAWLDEEHRVGDTLINSDAVATGWRLACGLNPNPGLQGNFRVRSDRFFAVRGESQDIG